METTINIKNTEYKYQGFTQDTSFVKKVMDGTEHPFGETNGRPVVLLEFAGDYPIYYIYTRK